MTEHEPDLFPASERLVGTSVSGLSTPNRGEPELLVVADADAAGPTSALQAAARPSRSTA